MKTNFYKKALLSILALTGCAHSLHSAIIVFDVDDVLIQKTNLAIGRNIGYCLATADNKLSLSWNLTRYGAQAGWYIKNLCKQGYSPEEAILLMVKEYPIFEQHLPTIFRMLHPHWLMPGMKQLVQDLKAQGHTLYIFTNKGNKRF